MNIFRLQLQRSTSKYASNNILCTMQRRAEDKINIVNRNHLYKNKKTFNACKQLFCIVYVGPTTSIYHMVANFLFFLICRTSINFTQETF